MRRTLANGGDRARPRHSGRAAPLAGAEQVLKVIEVLAESDKGWEDAARTAVEEAVQSVRNVRSVYIEHMQATVEGGSIAKYRVNAKITFELDDR
jgi:flavin-binding protein dodecin